MTPRTTMIYGKSGGTKTTQLYFLAKWILERNPGKTIRMIHGSPGGYQPFTDSGMIERGEVQVFDYNYRPLALADLRRLSEGYWPRRAKQKDGSIAEYFKTDENCLTKPEQWENIVGYFIEDMTSLSDQLLNHCSNQEGPSTADALRESYKYVEDGYTFLGLQKGHYNLVQKEIRARHVHGFSTLPVKYLVWTALVGGATDNDRKDQAIGAPQLAGSASNYKVPSWFVDTFYLDTKRQEVDKRVQESKIAWFKNHADPISGIEYLANIRVLPEVLPKIYEKFPGGYIPLGFTNGIDKYFRALEEIRG